jgi:hypothetical protein
MVKMVKMARKQRGGGMHSEYCPLCLLSYEPLPDIEEEDEYDEDDDEEEREVNQLKRLSNIDLNWLRNGLGFDRETNAIIPVEGDDMYGQFPIKGRKGEKFTAEMYSEGEFGWGPVYHEDCIKYVSAQLNRPVTYEDGIEIFKLVERRHGPFQDQHFQWEEAVEEEGPAYFISPMDPKGKETRERIDHPLAAWISRQKRVASPTGKRQLQREDAMKELSRVEAELKQAMDRVDALKREVATRKAALASLASPKKTRKVASKPQPAQQAQAQPKSAQPQVNCPSHKTQAECPPSDCVWGKTGKCSKKRAKK